MVNFVKSSQGSAALSIIYCPSQLFLAHVLKILTMDQSFKRSIWLISVNFRPKWLHSISRDDNWGNAIIDNAASPFYIFQRISTYVHSQKYLCNLATWAQVLCMETIVWLLWTIRKRNNLCRTLVNTTYNLKATYSTKESTLRWLYFRESVGEICCQCRHYYERELSVKNSKNLGYETSFLLRNRSGT